MDRNSFSSIFYLILIPTLGGAAICPEFSEAITPAQEAPIQGAPTEETPPEETPFDETSTNGEGTTLTEDPDRERSLSWWQRFLAVPSDLSSLFDQFHGFVSNRLVESSDAIDQFFGDVRIEDDDRVSLVTLRQEFRWAEKGDFETKTRFKARLPFPRLEERIRLTIDADSDEESLAGTPISVQDSDRERGAQLEYAIPFADRSSLSFGAGGRFDSGFKTRVEAKWRLDWNGETWNRRLLQRVQWLDTEGFSERTRIDLDRDLDLGRFRSRTEAEWGEETPGVELSQSISLAEALDEKTAISGSVGVSLHTRPSWIVDGYDLELRLRRQFYRKWLFFELSPRASFPRDRGYEFTPEMVVTLEVRFGGYLPDSRE